MLTILFNQATVPMAGGFSEVTRHTVRDGIKRRRCEIRQAIERAYKHLAPGKKRKTKRALRVVNETFEIFAPVAVFGGVLPAQLWQLDAIRAQIETVGRGIDRAEAARVEELHGLFGQYMDELKRIERDEEELAAALVLAVVARGGDD